MIIHKSSLSRKKGYLNIILLGSIISCRTDIKVWRSKQWKHSNSIWYSINTIMFWNDQFIILLVFVYICGVLSGFINIYIIYFLYFLWYGWNLGLCLLLIIGILYYLLCQHPHSKPKHYVSYYQLTINHVYHSTSKIIYQYINI